MFSLFVIVFLQLGAQDFCADLGAVYGEDYCNGEFVCRWTGSSGGCVSDDCADVSGTTFPDSLTGCSEDVYTYNGHTFYYRYSAVKNPNSISECSLYYSYTSDVLDTPTCLSPNCADIPVSGADGASYGASCTEYCYAYPEDTTCVGQPCTSTSGTVCCAIINSFSCEGFCLTSDGSRKYCCGEPQTYQTTSTTACQNYIQLSGGNQDQADLARCLADPTNRTACAMCRTYISCCSINKEKPESGPICEYFCNLPEHKNEDECKKRAQCLESLGHEPSEEELTKCGTSMVRLSSFCAAVLLGLVGYFVLGL